MKSEVIDRSFELRNERLANISPLPTLNSSSGCEANLHLLADERG
jgi:hypothetical protein